MVSFPSRLSELYPKHTKWYTNDQLCLFKAKIPQNFLNKHLLITNNKYTTKNSFSCITVLWYLDFKQAKLIISITLYENIICFLTSLVEQWQKHTYHCCTVNQFTIIKDWNMFKEFISSFWNFTYLIQSLQKQLWINTTRNKCSASNPPSEKGSLS